MLYGYKKLTLPVLIGINSLFLFLFIFNSYLLLSHQVTQPLPPPVSQHWWFLYSYQLASLGPVIASVGIPLLAGPVFLFLLARIFNRSLNSEVYFFSLFLSSFAWESVRLITALLFFHDGSQGIQLVLSKAVYFGRTAGLLALLFASLYAIEINYGKFGVILAIILLVSASLAYILPFDTSHILSHYLHQAVDEISIFFVNFALILIIIINYGIACLKKDNNTTRSVWLAMVVILASREVLLYYHPLYIVLPAAVLFIGALIVYTFRQNKLSNW